MKTSRYGDWLDASLMLCMLFKFNKAFFFTGQNVYNNRLMKIKVFLKLLHAIKKNKENSGIFIIADMK